MKKYFFILLCIWMAGCAVKPRQEASRKSAPSEKLHTETGMASYYNDKFKGRPTASGEKYNPQQLTAAHKTLPFGTQVKVTNLSNGKSVTVRINDRGPHKKGRVIDLSRKAAENLDMVKSGVVNVKLEYVKPRPA